MDAEVSVNFVFHLYHASLGLASVEWVLARLSSGPVRESRCSSMKLDGVPE